MTPISGIGKSKTRALGSNLGSARGGFTLFEIVLSLAVIAVLIGLCLPAFANKMSEQKLRDPARHMEELARTARNRAIDTQRTWTIYIRPTEMVLSLQTGEALSDDQLAAFPNITFPIADTVKVETKGWTDDAFSAPAEVRWIFRPNGLSEPLSVRFSQDDSNIALRFDPLTAEVAEETYAFH